MRTDEIRRGLILGLAFTAAGIPAIRPVAATDPDIWWRMRTGEWIIAHRALPHTEMFAWPVAGRPFVEYSWAFDVVADWLYRHGGLLSIAIVVCLVTLGIAALLYSVLRARSGNVVTAAGVTAVSMLSLGRIMTPRPWLFTVLLFTLELWILCSATATGKSRRVFWLIPLFLVWANLHIQFVYGLGALFLFCAQQAVAAVRHPTPESKRNLMTLAGACAGTFVATLATPFGVRLYSTVIEYAGQATAFRNISELQAPQFRTFDDYLLLLLLALAGMSVGLFKTKLEPFLVALCAIGAVLAFRSVRDVWSFVIPAAFLICNGSLPRISVPARAYGVAVVVCAGVLLPLAQQRLSAKELNKTVVEQFPVQACDYIERTQNARHIFTPFDWGGYVIWRLPQSMVSMDGRTNVHGDARIATHIRTANGVAGWENDQDLMQADLIVLLKDLPLAALLKQRSDYKLLYSDSVASVFAHADSAVGSTAAAGIPGENSRAQ